MIRFKGPAAATYGAGLAEEIQSKPLFPGAGLFSRRYAVRLELARSPFVDWRDTDRQVWFVAAADPHFGLRQIPWQNEEYGWSVESDGAGLFGATKLAGFQDLTSLTAYPGRLTGASVRSLVGGPGHYHEEWRYPMNRPVSCGILVQQAMPGEPTAYEIALGSDHWSIPDPFPGVPESAVTQSWRQSLATPVPAVACSLALSGCSDGGGPLIPASSLVYSVSTAPDWFGTQTHWPGTQVELVGGDWLRMELGGGGVVDYYKVPSDLDGKYANYYLEQETWALYCFAARDAVTWTAPSGVEVLYRTPAGVAPSVMICREEFQHRYWDAGRAATTDQASYLLCAAHFFRAAPHYQISMARRAGATVAHARTSNRSLIERQLPQPDGYTLPMPVPQNSLRCYWHRQGRVEITGQKPTMQAMIRGEVAVDGPSCDAPTLLEQSDGTLHLVYTYWGAAKHQVSHDGGETWGEMAALATVSEGYEAGRAALDEATGMLVVPLFKDGAAGGRVGEWYLTVGTKGAGDAYEWSAPRVVRVSQSIARYAKPWGAALTRQSDGSWLFVYTGVVALYDPALQQTIPPDLYPSALICGDLQPDGEGTWAEVPDV